MSDRKIDDRLKPDVEAERKAKGSSYSIHPIVDRVSKKLGAFNLIRNAKNQREAILQDVEDLES